MDYLRQWKASTETRPGKFSQNARAHMFLSWQTYEGLKITVNSVIEATKFLLQEGMDFVLTELSAKTRQKNILGSSAN